MALGIAFSGQGLQHAHMLRWLPDSVLSSQWRAQFDAHSAFENTTAQPLLVGTALHAWSILKNHLPEPLAVVGYSVGEMAACSAAGCFDTSTALQLTRTRAQAMSLAAENTPGGLLALHGLETTGAQAQVLKQLLEDTGTWLSIRTGSESCIAGGTLEAIERLKARLLKMHVSHKALAVQVASHTPLMRDAQASFAHALEHTRVDKPTLPLISNVTGARITDAPQLRSALVAQLTQPVQWLDCMHALHERGVRCLLEIGPGSALSAFWTRTFAGTTARSVDEFSSVDAIALWVKRHA